MLCCIIKDYNNEMLCCIIKDYYNKMLCSKKDDNPTGIKVGECAYKSSVFIFPPSIPFRIPPQLPQLPRQSTSNRKHFFENSTIITGCMVGCAFLFLIFMVLKYFNSKRNNRMIRNSRNQFDTPQEPLDEEHGFVIDNPIQYRVNQGIAQSVIDSITVWNYRKDEGLIDGTECSICLIEFEEDESLRLLPKCNHAFHISCIDIWLNSHKNCPLCRAPIVCENANVAQAIVSEPNLNSSSGHREEEENQLENVENNGGTISHRIEVGEERRNSENSMKGLCNCSPILRNLIDKEVIIGKEIQPIIRSASLDSSSASMIYHSLGNFIPDQGSSESLVKMSHLGIVSKQGSKNLSLYKLMKSSSMGDSLHKRSISMKSSWSSSRKKFSSKLLIRSLSSNLS